METGKLYTFKPSMTHLFVAESCSNKSMAEAILFNGGYFEVEDVTRINGEKYVSAVKFPKTGKCLDHDGSGDEYFEIYEDEFKYFTEYNEVELNDGVRSMTLDVNKTNAAAMIQLIQQTFLKD